MARVTSYTTSPLEIQALGAWHARRETGGRKGGERSSYLCFLGRRERLPLADGVALVDGRDGELRRRGRRGGVRSKLIRQGGRGGAIRGSRSSPWPAAWRRRPHGDRRRRGSRQRAVVAAGEVRPGNNYGFAFARVFSPRLRYGFRGLGPGLQRHESGCVCVGGRVGVGLCHMCRRIRDEGLK